MDTIVNVPEGYIAPFFQWDQSRTSKKLELSNDNLTCTVKEGSGFKTVMGNILFTPGNKYYFELFIEKGSLIKIGVSYPEINFEEAFSDYTTGWALYNGELRHNSNSSGQKYGKTINAQDTIGVAVDMIEGTISYYKNNVNQGVAFKDDILKEAELCPAAAPIYLNDAFSLKMMIRED